MKIENEWVAAYFERGVDVTNRRVFLGNIDHESVDAVVKGMYLMETQNHTDPIELFISSYGGEVYDAPCTTLSRRSSAQSTRSPTASACLPPRSCWPLESLGIVGLPPTRSSCTTTVLTASKGRRLPSART